MQLEAVTATAVLPRGALLKKKMCEKKKTLGTQEKKKISVRHRAQQHRTRSYSSKQHCKVL